MRGLVEDRIENFQSLIENPKTFDVDKLTHLSKRVLETFNNEGRLVFVGNGGSAAEAMHLAAEFTGRCVMDHKPLPAFCLNESQSALTAISNDYGVDQMFARQASALLSQKDILIALSTSGLSPNILRCLEIGKQKGAETYMWTGETAPEIPGVEIFRVPSRSTPRIQEIHLVWGHILAETVESFFK